MSAGAAVRTEIRCGSVSEIGATWRRPGPYLSVVRRCRPADIQPSPGRTGGRTRWAHFEFTRINIEPIILRNKIEDLRQIGGVVSVGPRSRSQGKEGQTWRSLGQYW